MNSYDDPSSARGRAHVSGSGGGYDYDGGHDPAADRGDANGRSKSAGRTAVGAASALAKPSASAPSSSNALGRASVGRASVPSPGYSYDEPSGGFVPTGGASGHPPTVPSGRVSVPGVVTGRAAVRPVSPSVPFAPGDPLSPGGPAGPGGRGPRGPGVAGRGRGSLTARAKRAGRRNWIIAALAVFIMLTGVVVVGGTYYYDDVALPTDFVQPEATTLFFADSKTQLAKLGEANRSIVPISAITPDTQHAVISAEDRNFLEHGGIDVQGIARAAWNNVTGGETQGASTITQQYARHVADLKDITYARKIREAVLANKLEQKFSKEKILESYLNVIYFGRGAYGIEAAAQTYFSKSVSKLSIEEAAVLAAVIKQPIPQQGGHQGFDPAYNPAAAKDRWGYVLDGMVAKGWLDHGRRATMQYPKVNPYDPNKPPCAVDCGVDQPTGNVINYVREEMKAMGYGDDWKQGGYQITTSIDQRMQKAAEKAARREEPGSVLDGQPPNLMAALVAIDPSTGRVLAYYGGNNGTGTDYAGYNYEGNVRTGGHSAGSSFKIYTLAAALKEGISINTHWDATKLKDGPFTISNAGRTPQCDNGGKYCTLEQATLQSYNVPFYWLTKAIGPDKVVEAAKAAGIKMMWSTDPDKKDAFNLTTKSGKEFAPSIFNTQVGYGQYPITVLDHANGTATFAARGVYRPAHFIVDVRKKDATGQWKKINGEQVKPKQVFDPNQVDDIVSVLGKYPVKDLAGDRPSGRKTGTWELNATSTENGDAWVVGFTPQIATAVWIGNVKNRDALRYYPNKANKRSTASVYGSNVPTDVWKKFMDEAVKGMPVQRFPDRKNTGADDDPRANGVPPAKAPSEKCLIPILCPGGGGPGDGGGGGGPGNGGGGGGGFLPPTTAPTIAPPRRR